MPVLLRLLLERQLLDLTISIVQNHLVLPKQQPHRACVLAPPTIANFKWQPTKIVNGKVYDTTISFDVESAGPVMSLTGILKSYAPTIPARAYPAEDPITLQFTTPAQSSSVTTYSANVANFRGESNTNSMRRR